MSAALGLFRLQQVDRQIDQNSARMSAIKQVLENDLELRQALSQVDEAAKMQAQAEAMLREAEAVGRAQQIKIEQAQSSLYGGQVHNPKELQDLQNDVTSLTRHLGTLEDRQLEAMLGLEEAQAAVKAAQAELSGIQSRRGDDHLRLVEEQNSLVRSMERLSAERQAIMADIPAQDLKIYDNLRERRRGIAVAGVADNSCAACGTTLTAALQQAAHSTTQLTFCPSCGRILYAS
ncbi:MAG: zinc ribbon domain-containing protein [Bacteroidota bacterium]